MLAASLPAASRPLPNERRAGEEKAYGFARTEQVGDLLDPLRRYACRLPNRRYSARLARLAPRKIRRHDQRGHGAGRSVRRGDRARGRFPHSVGALQHMNPPGNGARKPFHVVSQRRIETAVPGRMLAHNAHHRRVRLLCVVEIAEAVGQPRAEVQQCGRRLPEHPRIAIRRPGADSLEQAKDAPQPGHAVQSRDELHLRRARIGETEAHPVRHQSAEQNFSSQHVLHRFLVDLIPSLPGP